MSNKNVGILNISEAVIKLSSTTLATIGIIAGNPWLTALPAIPPALLDAVDTIRIQLKERKSQKEKKLELSVPPWWTTDPRFWEDLCVEISRHLPNIFQGMVERLKDQDIVTREVVQQIFIDTLKAEYLTWAPTSEERGKVAEFIAWWSQKSRQFWVKTKTKHNHSRKLMLSA